MTAPPWGQKPPGVNDPFHFYGRPAPQLSARCQYWLRRIDEGTWIPNKHLWKQSYTGRAVWLGVWIWEANKIIVPRLLNLTTDPDSQCGRALGHSIADCCASCHAENESDGSYMCDAYDRSGHLTLHACCRAYETSRAHLGLVQPWRRPVDHAR